MPAYLVGSYFGRFYDIIKKDEYIKYIISIVFIALLLDGINDGAFRTIAIELLPITAVLYLPTCQQLVGKKIYNMTFLMYAIHEPLIGDFKQILVNIYNLNIPISLSNLFVRFGILIIDIFIASAVFVVLNKICPKILKLLTGGR